ncbi:DUF2637 domain-containing protein [Streptomyces sp. TRM66268-LWL]|uniref:DUF2637 domain-containing protein n=1 Tax=Streptomyces polyasparticus TaxID=2767826 RepID=A0ABR7SSN8_9ACTN|nr:DUF2637 domain-containing protein [Streptomyces polyasparticus]MBC9718413.1 DUF2637 domain-containing protein [Streptomyces polyasparticus]
MTHITATHHTPSAAPTVRPPARRMSSGLRNLIVAGAAVVAVVAMIASADALTALGRAVGWSEIMAWALPVSVDVLALVAGFAWLAASAAQRLGRWLTLGSVSMSVVLNAVGHLVSTGHLKSNSFLVILVSAVPPVAAALAVHLGAKVNSDGADATADAAAASQAVEAGLTDRHGSTPDRQIDRDRDASPEPRAPLYQTPVTQPTHEKQVSRWLSTVPADSPQNREDGDRTESGTGTGREGDRPHTVPNDNGDREHPDTETGTEPEEHRPHTVPSHNGDRAEADSSTLPEGTTAVVKDRGIVPDQGEGAGGHVGGNPADAHVAAAQGDTGASPAAVPNGDEGREHPDTESGTEPEGDRPHTVPNDNGDREHPDAETGTEPEGDRPHTVPVRRKPKPKPKAQRSRPGGGKPKRPRRKQLSLEETAELVRPHIPALLERDGNAVITRSQLREILRSLNLAGGRNENLTRLLQLLRDEAGTTTTGSTTR